MKRRKTSLFIALVLALSLALSPVSAYADELDTPVHEDPIDELQSGSGWIGGHFTVYCPTLSGTNTVVFDANAFCEYTWTEGIGAQFQTVTIFITNITINGYAAGYESASPIYIDSYGIRGRARQSFTYSNFGFAQASFMVKVFCDEYGDLSINAGLPE